MSSHSYDAPCPNCNKAMNMNEETRPFHNTSAECPYCGFAFYAKAYQMDLEELNEIRADQELKPLGELPKMNQDLINS